MKTETAEALEERIIRCGYTGIKEEIEARDAAIRREALEDACGAQCKYCRDGLTPTKPGVDWIHNNYGGIHGEWRTCFAAPIRSLMEEPNEDS